MQVLLSYNEMKCNDSDDLPMPKGWESSERMLLVPREVRLDTLAAKAGDERRVLRRIKDWSKVLSLRKQQRLAFNKPDVVVPPSPPSTSPLPVYVEATCALDLSSEEAMYQLLSAEGNGILFQNIHMAAVQTGSRYKNISMGIFIQYFFTLVAFVISSMLRLHLNSIIFFIVHIQACSFSSLQVGLLHL
jgi:hypothetical protein